MKKIISIILSLFLFTQAYAQVSEEFTVLCYHEIAEKTEVINKDLSVTPTMFVRQIDWLRNDGYSFIGINDILASRNGTRALPKKSILLTFDDGYSSMYKNAWPILKMFKIPAIVSVVGHWEEEKNTVNFDGNLIARNFFMSWQQLREMSDSGLIEVASHTYNLHRGILGNPQGNLEPAAVTRQWFNDKKQYESESAYITRIKFDLRLSGNVIRANIGRAPRAIAWPYGNYNSTLMTAAQELGVFFGLTLDDGGNEPGAPLYAVRRILVEGSMSLNKLGMEILKRNKNLKDNDIPQKIAHVDLDMIYDSDVVQQERNLSHLLNRLNWLGVNVVYLQAYSDPDSDGTADAVYFPNRHLPMRADLFNRVAWQIRTRTPIKRVYAWMPLLAWDLPTSNPINQHLVVTLPSENREHLNMGYKRLSPFSSDARKLIKEVYEDLARSSTFEGVLFHDDVTLSDYEDSSLYALKAYNSWGFAGSVEDIRKSDDLLGRWTILKINALDNFAVEVANTLRLQQPTLLTARNMYAQVVLNPRAEVWYSQALQNSIANYDFTAIMAMPYMENSSDNSSFYDSLVRRVKEQPGAMRKVVFELQTVDWRHSQRLISTEEISETIDRLYKLGVHHVGYYPDMMFENHPSPALMRSVFSHKINVLE